MCRLVFLFAFSFLLSSALLMPNAHAAILPGQPCTDPGKTTLDDRKENVVACVCKTLDTGCGFPATANLIWKSMSPDNVTCGSNLVATALKDGRMICGLKAVVAGQDCTSPQVMIGINANGIIKCGTVASNGTSTGTGGGGSGMHICPYDTAGIAVCGSRNTCRGQVTTATTCNSCAWNNFMTQVNDVTVNCP